MLKITSAAGEQQQRQQWWQQCTQAETVAASGAERATCISYMCIHHHAGVIFVKGIAGAACWARGPRPPPHTHPAPFVPAAAYLLVSSPWSQTASLVVLDGEPPQTLPHVHVPSWLVAPLQITAAPEGLKGTATATMFQRRCSSTRGWSASLQKRSEAAGIRWDATGGSVTSQSDMSVKFSELPGAFRIMFNDILVPSKSVSAGPVQQLPHTPPSAVSSVFVS
jgi:hypothetical protein